MKITAVHRATVTDDTHRTDGALVLDGAIWLKAPTFTGSPRDGWPDDGIGWISPMLGPVLQVPAVGEDVLLVQFDGGELRWANLGLDRTLPAWFTLDMTALVSKGGAIQAVLTETALLLGAYNAADLIALHPGLKTYINDVCRAAYRAHKHTGGTGGGGLTGTPDPTTIDLWTSMDAEGRATKVKAV